jgi:16S rRNA A1518/A1519 N6-dimethyltransferase RsmA/KsgA/DIM1 with predicted DNA glycosylase/AP lyase activity
MEILGIIITIFIFSAAIIFFLIFSFRIIFFWLLPMAFWGAIYVKSQNQTIKEMILLAEIKPGDKAVDLGSGNGSIVIALAKAGAEAHGYEIDPYLVWLSKKNIKKGGLENKAFIHWGNFWQKNFSDFDVVTVFGISYIMKSLETKLKKELKTNSKIISNSFVFPNWKPLKKINNTYLYKK